MANYLLAIDQGTTSTRAFVYDETGACIAGSSRELKQYYPRPGWVEHDPEEIWRAVCAVVPEAIGIAGLEPRQLAAVGITNQRETAVIWERSDGKTLGPAIVWQDRRTADFCRERLSDEHWVRQRTGLVLDPYFSATKFRWILDQEAAWRYAAEAGKLAVGTIDSFLLWRLTGGRRHLSDRTNASRTLLLNLERASWDADLCRYFGIPMAALPEVCPSAGDLASVAGVDFLPEGLPISGVAGDQQSALFAQGGVELGDAKCTYGTGAFFLLHTGVRRIDSRHRLVGTLAASAGAEPQFALEGSIFIAGAAVQWLRDGLKLFAHAEASAGLAEAADAQQDVIFVPALTGLGAPHWVPDARGVLFGLTRGTSAPELARAALEGVAFQVSDLVRAACEDAGVTLHALRADGGMSRNDRFMQWQADLLGLPVLRAADAESTARGAALLAGVGVGLWSDLITLRSQAAGSERFDPSMETSERESRIGRWKRAVRAVIEFYRPDRAAEAPTL